MRVSSSAQRGAFAPVRFGLVGYGFGARYFHAPLIASATECQLVAVATRSAGAAYVTLRRMTGTNAGSPTGRESYGDGGLVVVAGVTTGQGGRESRPQGEVCEAR
jgi:hypothetical protein